MRAGSPSFYYRKYFRTGSLDAFRKPRSQAPQPANDCRSGTTNCHDNNNLTQEKL
jgi:hypothetical protein